MSARLAKVASDMGDYIQEFGFSPDYHGDTDNCGCFLHAFNRVSPEDYDEGEDSPDWVVVWKAIADVTGAPNYYANGLRSVGFNSDATVRAADACRKAADLLKEST